MNTVAAGTPVEVIEQTGSVTADYLAGRVSIPVPERRRQPNGKALIVHNEGKLHRVAIDGGVPEQLSPVVPANDAQATAVYFVDDHFLLQPMDCADAEGAKAAAIDYVMRHPRWKLSLQTHKLLGLP